ncbi:MAG: hypothetical protein ABI184_00865 [Ginsengibacter sp.]
MQHPSKKFLVFTLLFLGACTNSNNNNHPNAITPDEKPGNSDLKRSDVTEFGYFKPDGDSLIIPTFEIEVNLSPKAKAKLSKNNETIIVSASFIGMPKDTTSEDFKNSGQIGIAGKDIEIRNDSIAKFENIRFSKSLYDSLADKDIQLLINVFSGRHSSPDNLLNCGIIQEKMSKVKGKIFTIDCKLIYGED